MAEDTSKTSIPKFTSFRPKSSIQTSQQSTEQPAKELRDKQRHRSDERRERHQEEDNVYRKKRKQDDDRKHQRDKSYEKDLRHDGRKRKAESEDRTLVPAYTDSLSNELFENQSEFFQVDRKGDSDNLRYRSLHKYDIPAYKRIGFGRVLGGKVFQRIDRTASDERSIVLVEPEHGEPGVRRLLERPRSKDSRKLRFIRPIATDDIPEHGIDFIELRPTVKQLPTVEESVIDQDENDFRSIEGKAKPHARPDDSDFEWDSAASDNKDAKDETDQITRTKNAELSRRARENPQDLEAWQNLIEHQRDVLGFPPGDLSDSKSRILADIKISIYEQAIKLVRDPDALSILSLGMLEEGSRIWEFKKLSSKWQETIQKFNNNPSVWIAYLDFVQGSTTEFRYERCRDEYINCLRLLGELIQREATQGKVQELSTILVYVFLRLTSFMRDAGYHEFAQALWQAVLEIYFFGVAKLESEGAVGTAFEQFWESEVPRIGEEDARGWLNFVPDAQEPIDPVTVELDAVKSSRRMFSDFVVAEQRARLTLSHPGRSADDAGEDDPYHIVLFNDIQLVLFPHMLKVVHKEDLLVAFLRYSYLPLLPWLLTKKYESWWLDPFILAKSDAILPYSHFQVSTDALFTDAFNQATLQNAEWTRKVLRNLVDACPEDDAFAEYFVAFEYQFFRTNVAKTTKGLLKTRSSSLRLYNCYGILESRMKSLEAGSRVFSTAIQMSANLPDVQRRYTVLLHRTWMWEALRVGDWRQAISILLAVGNIASLQTLSTQSLPVLEDGNLPQPAVLRATRWLKDGKDATTSSEPHLITLYVELLALLSYFQHGKSLGLALDIYSSATNTFASYNMERSPAHEHFHQARAKLINLHLSSSHAYKPSLLRSVLAESISIFPSNTMLLSIYNKVAPSFNLNDRLHSLIDQVVLADGKDTFIGWSFALSSAMQRSIELGGTVHSIRAIFERALSRSGKHNIGLWNAFFLFECDEASLSTFGAKSKQNSFKQAKSVFLRGLRELPWSKWWVISGLEKLASSLDFEEASRIWKVLGERELRVHVDIEEIVEDEEKRRDKERDREIRLFKG